MKNQVTITLKSADAERMKYCEFQVNRTELRDMLENYANDNFFTHIPAKLKA